ncbi:hypothetical protein GOBAR_AA06444 [Gossypium barbadense]|uniref:Uncharacterized protein n=1 Tax=Gossypium barbadense TaxID=3634 RepID=A0A2P5YEX5_GOSBA|nr:hypothetical protein GOBAR_AA06444 [Gossypium barbadense]
MTAQMPRRCAMDKGCMVILMSVLMVPVDLTYVRRPFQFNFLVDPYSQSFEYQSQPRVPNQFENSNPSGASHGIGFVGGPYGHFQGYASSLTNGPNGFVDRSPYGHDLGRNEGHNIWCELGQNLGQHRSGLSAGAPRSIGAGQVVDKVQTSKCVTTYVPIVQSFSSQSTVEIRRTTVLASTVPLPSPCCTPVQFDSVASPVTCSLPQPVSVALSLESESDLREH